MQHLDSLAACFGERIVGGLGLRKGRFRWQGERVLAEGRTQRSTYVFSIKASHITQCKDLCENSTETPCLVVIATSCVRSKLGCLAQCHHSFRDHRRNELSSHFTHHECILALGAVCIITCYDLLDLRDGICDDGGAVVDNLNWRGVIYWVFIDFWYC